MLCLGCVVSVTCETDGFGVGTLKASVESNRIMLKLWAEAASNRADMDCSSPVSSLAHGSGPNFRSLGGIRISRIVCSSYSAT